MRLFGKKNVLLELNRRFGPQTDELIARERRLDTREQHLIIREEKSWGRRPQVNMLKRPKSTSRGKQATDMQVPAAEAEVARPTAVVDSLQQPQLHQQHIA